MNILDHMSTKTDEEHREGLQIVMNAIAERRKAEPLRTAGMSIREILIDMINAEFPKLEQQKQEAIEEAIRNGRPDLAAELKRRHLGIDTFGIKLVNEKTGKDVEII